LWCGKSRRRLADGVGLTSFLLPVALTMKCESACVDTNRASWWPKAGPAQHMSEAGAWVGCISTTHVLLLSDL
jgi:hypothetical protein